jgi:hypothetical protein
MAKWQNPTQTPTYFSWKDMRRRCLKNNFSQWKDYGGREIRICDRWVNDYDAFVEDMGLRQPGMTLERVDNDKGYSKDNCCWATRTVQNRNNRRNRYLEYQGQRKLLTDWAADLGIAVSTLHERLTKGYTPELIFHQGPIQQIAGRRPAMQFDL